MSIDKDPKFLILKYSAWLDAARFEDKILGALVKEYADPAGIDYMPDSPLQYYNEDEFIEGTFDDFIVAKMRSSNHETSMDITSLGGAKLKGDKEDKIKLEGKLIHMKRLQRQPKFWEDLKSSSDVQARLPGWMTIWTLLDPVCLVVGIMICEDVDAEYGGTRSREIEAHGEVPVAQTIAPGAGVVTPDLGNVRGRVAAQESVETTFSGKSAGRKIFALELKIVTTPFFRKKRLELWKMKSQGPRVPMGRLLGAEATKTQGGGPVAIDDLLLEDVDDEFVDDPEP